MSYRLVAHEEPARGIKRIVCEQIEQTLQELADNDVDRHTRVHQARQRFKKIRGVLRLVRLELGDVYHTENVWFRDLGRELSQVRDAAVMLETFDNLCATFAEQLRPKAFRAVRAELVHRCQTLADAQEDLDKRLAAIGEALGEATQRVRSWPLHMRTYTAVSSGLSKTYRRGRTAWIAAYHDPTPERFHAWRKRVKYHWYHVRLLQDVWPAVMRGYRHTLKELADLLGADHDTAVFGQTLREHREIFGADRDIQVILGLIDRRQAELQTQAETLGRRIFAEKPTRFGDRLHQYMKAWQAETQQSSVLAERG